MDDLLLLSGGPSSPADIPGLKIWLKGDAGFSLSDGDPIASWNDQSGGGHNFTESTNKPTYKTNIRNGLAVVRFTDISSQILSGGDLSALFSTGASVFAAANGTNGSGKQMIYEHQSIDSWWQFGNSGYFGPFRSSRLAGTGTFTNGWHVWSVTADNGSNYKVWLDGVNKINDTAGFTFQAGNSHVIGRQRANGETDGQDIGEILVYDNVLSDADRQWVESYLNDRWIVASASATPSATAGTGAVPAATTTGAATAAPSTVAGVGAVPAPNAHGPIPTGFPDVTAGVGAVPAPTVQGSSVAAPAATAGTGAVPSPTATGGAKATPSTVAGVAAIPSPRFDATIPVATVAGVGAVPHATAVGVGTGGGGGSVNGVTDFWVLKGLG